MDWFGTPVRRLAGGYSGETFLVGDAAERVVMRVYTRQPQRAAVDASLLRLVRGIVPVPEVVELRPATADQPAVLVTEYLDGVLLEELLRIDPPGLDYDALGASIGAVLAALSCIPFLRPGMFADADLTLATEGMPHDLVAWAQHFRDTGRLAAWSEADWHGLLRLVDTAETLLDEADRHDAGRTVLAHSDFNPKNLLVDPATASVVGVLDWEFAHAGSPVTDVGNLTRFERDPRLHKPLLEAFVGGAPGRIRDPFVLGRAVDLWALVELAGNPSSNAVRELAAELLLAQARSGDLEAWPWDGPRVDPAGGQPVS